MALPTEPPLIAAAAPHRRSALSKIAAIAVLVLLLHVPLMLTHRIVSERKQYQAQVAEEISSTWGCEQRLIGPVLAVPYLPNSHTGQSVMAYFLPDQLTVDAVVEPKIRHRGIFNVVVYAAHLKLKGSVRADFAGAGIETQHIDWSQARLLLGLSDLHGLRSISPLHRADGVDAPFAATEAATPGALGLAADAGIVGPAGDLTFSVEAVVQGSGTFLIAPVGKTMTAQVQSSWKSPSFTGAWLPVTRQLSADGFTAEWTIPPFSRGFPQSWTALSVGKDDMSRKIGGAAFGVRLDQGVDDYSVVERAQKYGILFFVLVFAVYFLFEVTSALSIHPLQYAIVGAALCLFFLGFLALSEFWPIAAAYAVAAAACTAMVSLYSWTFLRSGGRTLVVGLGLGATYGYLYFVLKSEDYALIAGTTALFAMLAIAMYVTRRINWYTLDVAPHSASRA